MNLFNTVRDEIKMNDAGTAAEKREICTVFVGQTERRGRFYVVEVN
jgi:hypothetical protein